MAQQVAAAVARAGIDPASLAADYSVLRDGASKPQLIVEAATDFGAGLIVLGPHQAAPKDRFMAGSTADALLDTAPAPLALSPRGVQLAKRGVSRINFAYTAPDASEHDLALHHASGLACRWNLPLRILSFSPEGLASTEPLPASLRRTWQEHSLSLLDRARETAASLGVPEVSSELGAGAGWQGAVDSLKWKKGDLLVLGAAPVGPLTRVFLGSIATELLPHLRVPVVTYPVHKER